ncbi:MAG: OmpA family protein [Bacteroidia bacterium]|nr:OmpA family protein [Bacteroidia bacterium]
MRKGLLLLTLATSIAMNSIAGGTTADAGASVPKKAYKKWSIGINGGLTQFYGDVRQYDWYPIMKKEAGKSQPELGFGVQGVLTRSLSNVFGLRGSLMYGTLAGMKRSSNSAFSSYFKSSLIEYDLTVYANISNMFYTDKAKPRFLTIYGFAGAGLMHFRTLRKNLKTDAFMSSQGYKLAGTEKKEMTTETVFPVGAGAKFRLSKSLDLSLEATLVNVNSDKLDAKVGNSFRKDKYLYTSLGLAFKFGKKGAEESTEWTNPYAEIAKDQEEIRTNIDGLSKDTDGDGVSDLFDKEANTPAGVTVDGSGKSVDTDKDGVPDHLDADPFTAKGAKVGSDGKELDSDGDGVYDSKDLEPNTPSGTLVNFQGKAISVKPADVTPAAASVSYAGGLPSIFFKVNSSRIDYWSSFDKLAEVAQVLKASPSAKVKIIGHADPTGAEGLNKTLSEKRAQAAADHLKKVYGIDASRLIVESKGKSEPLATSKEAYNVDRRVDFQLVK